MTAMGLVQYWDLLNSADKTSIYCQFFFASILIAYMAFVLYFAVVKSRKLARGESGLQDDESLLKIVGLHSDLLFAKNAKGCTKQELKNAKATLMNVMVEHKKKSEEASMIIRAQFDNYLPLLDGLRLENASAILANILITTRRCILLYTALYVKQR